jgi:transposase
MRGHKYNKKQREEIIRNLSTFLKLGYSISKSCLLSGVPDSTIQDWINADDTLRIKFKSLRSLASASAREVIVKKIVEEKDFEASKWWLQRMERKTFGRNLDLTTGNKPLTPISSIEWIIKDKQQEE